MKKLALASALAMLFSIGSGGVFATMPSGAEKSWQDAPVDCKKNPEHPRCADKK
jgi:hypothetical protein